MAGIASPPAEGRWDVAAWDGGPDGLPIGVWEGDARGEGLTLLLPGGAFRFTRMGSAIPELTPKAGSATVNRRIGSASGGGRA